jgi:hypothetical protein
MNNRILRLACGLVLVCLCALTDTVGASAQITEATLQGRVLDTADRAPASVTDEDFRALRSEFGEQGAAEVLLQTAAFSFMNRFTDGLRLPSEDEAIRVYRETYGADFQ